MLQYFSYRFIKVETVIFFKVNITEKMVLQF